MFPRICADCTYCTTHVKTNEVSWQQGLLLTAAIKSTNQRFRREYKGPPIKPETISAQDHVNRYSSSI